MTQFIVTAPTGQKFKINAPEGATQEQALAYAQEQFAAQQPKQAAPQQPVQQPAAPAEAPAWMNSGLANAAGVGAGETLLQLGSSIASAPIAGVAGALSAPFVGADKAANIVRNVQGALTYEPRSDQGKQVSGIVNYPFEKLAQGADYVGGKTAELTGSPLAGAVANTAIQALPAVFLKGRSGKPSVVPKARVEPTIGEAAGNVPRVAETPEVTRAKDYVAGTLRMDWNSLSDTVRKRITNIAKDAKTLDKLDPAAVGRQARLESLPAPVPATRGQLTRDPVQLRNEGNVSATETGKPIREVYVAQNRALIQNLDILKGKVSGKGAARSTSETPEQVGSAVQDAARDKLAVKKAEVRALYKYAESSGEMQGKVSTRGLVNLLKETPDKTHLGYVYKWLRQMNVADKTGQASKGQKLALTLKEMEDLRQAAVARAMDGGTEGYYAGKVIRAVDEATDGEGGKAYQAARRSRKEQALEFDEQGGVNALVENKSRTDRAIALEDTWRRTVLGGSIQDLRNVKTSLMTGGSAETRLAGRKAWRDIRAETIRHITNEATKSVTRFEDGTPNVTPAAMERAIKSVGKPKLNEIFGPTTVRQIEKIMEATRDVKTEPPAGFKGSPTFANIIAFLEKGIGKIPLVGDTVSGAVRGIVKLREMGASGREVREAQRTPLDEGVKISTVEQKRKYNRDVIRGAYSAAIPTQSNKP